MNFPEEIVSRFQIGNPISVHEHAIVFPLYSYSSQIFSHHITTNLTISKNIKADYIVKVQEKDYFSEDTYEQLSLANSNYFLLPEQYYFQDKYVFAIFPYCTSLLDLLSTHPFSFAMLNHVINDLSIALLSLQEQHILHLDISPGNIFFPSQDYNPSFHFMLGDFSNYPETTYTPPKDSFLYKEFHRTKQSQFHLTDTLFQKNARWDIYSFSMIIFLILNQGISPHSNRQGNFQGSSQLKEFLLNALTPSKKFWNHINSFTDFYDKLKEMIIEDTELGYDHNKTIPLTDVSNTSLGSITKVISPRKKSVPLLGLLLFSVSLLIVSIFITIFTPANSKERFPHSGKSSYTSNIILNSDIPDISNTPISSDPPVATNNFYPSSSSLPPDDSDSFLHDNSNIIDIANRDYKDSSFLDNCAIDSIHIIFANQNQFTNLHAFSSLSSLEELYLNNNRISSIKGIKQFQKLKILDLSENNITNISELSFLPHLTILNLSSNKNLQSFLALKKLKSLSTLIVTDTNIKQEQIQQIQSALPKCTIFY